MLEVAIMGDRAFYMSREGRCIEIFPSLGDGGR